MKIIWHRRFEKSYKKLSNNIKNKVNIVVDIFIKNPYDISLRNHALNWEYSWLRSIDVSWNYRIYIENYLMVNMRLLNYLMFELIMIYINFKTYVQNF